MGEKKYSNNVHSKNTSYKNNIKIIFVCSFYLLIFGKGIFYSNLVNLVVTVSVTPGGYLGLTSLPRANCHLKGDDYSCRIVPMIA